MKPLRVEVNLFSTRPNPGWQLSSGQAREFEEKLAGLQAMPAATRPPTFGYRGLILSGPEASSEKDVRVFDGIVERGAKFFQDVDRNLERWLLETAGDAIPADIRETIRSEF